MKSLFCLSLILFPIFVNADWKIVDNTAAQSNDSPLIYERFTVSQVGDNSFFATKRIDVIWFNSKTHTFRVIDNDRQTRPPTRTSLPP